MTVARMPKELHVTIKVDTSKLDAALDRYNQALADLAAIQPCLAQYPGDPAGPDYVGTRCQLLEGHDREGALSTPHRHRMLGSQAVVTW